MHKCIPRLGNVRQFLFMWFWLFGDNVSLLVHKQLLSTDLHWSPSYIFGPLASWLYFNRSITCFKMLLVSNFVAIMQKVCALYQLRYHCTQHWVIYCQVFLRALYLNQIKHLILLQRGHIWCQTVFLPLSRVNKDHSCIFFKYAHRKWVSFSHWVSSYRSWRFIKAWDAVVFGRRIMIFWSGVWTRPNNNAATASGFTQQNDPWNGPLMMVKWFPEFLKTLRVKQRGVRTGKTIRWKGKKEEKKARSAKNYF